MIAKSQFDSQLPRRPAFHVAQKYSIYRIHFITNQQAKMERTIPGSVEVTGREFFYIENSGFTDFHQLINAVMKTNEDLPLPQDGGAIEEKTRLLLEEGMELDALSYKGDITGWRRKLTAYCEQNNLKWGIASQNRLKLSDQSERDLRKCNVIFDD